jgi:tetratricopeptide (TPR) repeat protein
MFRGKSLMKIDVEALSDYVGTLVGGYAAAGRENAIAQMLDRLRGNIDDQAWYAKIAYHKSIERLWHDDRNGAAAELANAGPITAKSDDVELLQIQLDLHGGSMGLAETLGYMDRILELTTSRTDRIQYGGARAFQLVMAGDEKGGFERLLEVVGQGREMEAEQPFGTMTEVWFCRALEGVAVSTGEQKLFDEVVERLERLLAGPTLSRKGRAYIGRSIGDAHRYAGKYEPAIAAYRAAYEREADDVLLVFEAECRLRLGDSDEALRVLRNINASTLDGPEHADFAFTYFYVALARKDREALETARVFLRTARTPQPYFEKLRLSHIVTVQDALAALAEKRPLPKSSGFLAVLRSLSRYIQLQPNIVGIGINLNNALDDIADRIADRSGEPPHDQEG